MSTYIACRKLIRDILESSLPPVRACRPSRNGLVVDNILGAVERVLQVVAPALRTATAASLRHGAVTGQPDIGHGGGAWQQEAKSSYDQGVGGIHPGRRGIYGRLFWIWESNVQSFGPKPAVSQAGVQSEDSMVANCPISSLSEFLASVVHLKDCIPPISKGVVSVTHSKVHVGS